MVHCGVSVFEMFAVQECWELALGPVTALLSWKQDVLESHFMILNEKIWQNFHEGTKGAFLAQWMTLLLVNIY